MPDAFELSDQLVDDMVTLDPLFATALGITSAAGTWGDVGLEGYAARYVLARGSRDAFASLVDHPDPKHRTAATDLGAAMRERIAEFDHGDHLVDLAHMASSFQLWVRVFDIMPKDFGEDWEHIISRLDTINGAYAGLQERLEAGRASGRTVARRQVESVVAQAERVAGPGSAFDRLVSTAPDELRSAVVAAVQHAKAATSRWATYLAKHLYRATRVVVDIGLHLGLEIPDHAPIAAGAPWTFDAATEYLRVYGFRTPDQAVGEVLRYLGWPGRAISYKLGEREILAIRDEARRRLGPDFDLEQFHDRIIGYGAMRFDVLRPIVLEGAGY